MYKELCGTPDYYYAVQLTVLVGYDMGVGVPHDITGNRTNGTRSFHSKRGLRLLRRIRQHDRNLLDIRRGVNDNLIVVNWIEESPSRAALVNSDDNAGRSTVSVAG